MSLTRSRYTVEEAENRARECLGVAKCPVGEECFAEKARGVAGNVVIAYLVWGFIYFAHFWGLNGRTAGEALFGVQVLTDEGGDVSFRRAALRTLAFPLSFIILGLGFLGILLGDQRRALHDVIAGTVVVYSWDARAARLRFLSRESSPVGPPARPAPPQSPG